MRVQQKRWRPSLCCNNSRSKSNTKDFEDRERVCRAIKRKIFSKLWVISQRKGFDVKTVSRRKMWAASLACGKDLDTVLQEDSSVFGHVPIFSFTFKNRPTAHCWPVNCSFPDCWIFYARSSFIFLFLPFSHFSFYCVFHFLFGIFSEAKVVLHPMWQSTRHSATSRTNRGKPKFDRFQWPSWVDLFLFLFLKKKTFIFCWTFD